MNTLDAIRARRSIRKYTSQSVSLDTIHQLLEAGMCAPSTHNKKSAEFIVIQDRATLNCFAEYGKYHKMLKEASCVILVCGNTEKMSVHDFVINDCSAAIENILIAATDLGLGTVWLGIKIDEMKEFYKRECNLPDYILPVGLIAIGYPDEVKETGNRYDESRVHLERY